jgi:hypothetical protein
MMYCQDVNDLELIVLQMNIGYRAAAFFSLFCFSHKEKISSACSDCMGTVPQRLRCRCNFHALRFVYKIQETGAVLVERLHGHRASSSPLKDNLLGQFAVKSDPRANKTDASKYLAVHLRFEIDMVAYSLCYFGGGKDEEDELETYRQIHFPVLSELKKMTKYVCSSTLHDHKPY